MGFTEKGITGDKIAESSINYFFRANMITK